MAENQGKRRPGSAKIPHHVLAQLRYYFKKPGQFPRIRDVHFATVFQVSSQTIANLRKGVHWPELTPQPLTKQFTGLIEKLDTLLLSFEFLQASAEDRQQMIRETTESLLPDLYRELGR